MRVLRHGGTALIYVWAFEQERNKHKSNYLKDVKIKTKPPSRACLGSQCDSNVGNAEERKHCNRLCADAEAGNFKELGSENEINRATVGCAPGSHAADETGTSHAVGSSKTDDSLSKPATSTDSLVTNVSVSSGSTNPPDTAHGTEVNDTAADYSDSNDRGTSATAPLPVHVNRTHFQCQDMLVPWHLRKDGGKKQKAKDDSKAKADDAVYHRYYHVFVEQELEGLCRTLPNVSVVKSYYDKGNWCVIVEKT